MISNTIKTDTNYNHNTNNNNSNILTNSCSKSSKLLTEQHKILK